MDLCALLPPRPALLRNLSDPAIDARDFRDPHLPVQVLHRHNLVVRPMEVICDVGYLLGKPLQGVANHSPEISASSSKLASHLGHVTDSRLCPFSLMRVYRSCR